MTPVWDTIKTMVANVTHLHRGGVMVLLGLALIVCAIVFVLSMADRYMGDDE